MIRSGRLSREWRWRPAAVCRRRSDADMPSALTSGDGMPTLARASRARARAAGRAIGSCARTVSTIWVSMRSTGFSVRIGSWKIIAMRLPRSCRICSSESLVRSRPANTMRPPTMRAGGSTSRMIEWPVIDLPEPDSPSRPSTSPRPSMKLTSSTAFDHAPCGKAMRTQAVDLQQRLGHRCRRGFRISPSRSATRLMLRIVSRSATPGKKLIQYLPESR